MKHLTLIALVLLAGCDVQEVSASRMAAGELRQKLFAQCMELAAKNAREMDDDVSDLVDSCDAHARNTANQSTP